MNTTTDLAVREDETPALRLPALPSLPDTDSWIRAMHSIAKLADQICGTSFVPKGLRGDPAAVTAAILTGRELGLPPMAALRHIHVVEGTPSLDAEYKRAKVQSLGHDFDIVEWDHEHCIVSGRRKGSKKPPLIVSYTIADARKAELVKSGSNYIKRPRVMMLARATTLMCSALFSDVTNGLATTELLESGDADAIADAIGAALEMPAPAAPRVTADAARARNPQTVQATAEPVEEPPPWAAAPDPADRDAPGSIAPAQITAIWTLLKQVFAFGEDEKDQARGVCAQILRREVASTKEMSRNEGGTVLDTLQQWQRQASTAGEEPRGYLVQMLNAAGDPRDEDAEAAGDGE